MNLNLLPLTLPMETISQRNETNSLAFKAGHSYLLKAHNLFSHIPA